MLDMGFLPAVRRIVRETPAERQTLLFSATLDEEAVGEITDLVSDPARVEIAPATSTADTVDQFVFPVSIEAKNNLLPEFLKKEGPERTIVFMRTKHRADSCCRRLERKGIKAAAIHAIAARPSASALSRPSATVPSTCWWQPTCLPAASTLATCATS